MDETGSSDTARHSAGRRRLALLCAAGLSLLACRQQSAPARQDAPPPPQPPAAAGPDLPALERERLGFLFDAAQLVARDWPQLAAADVCILLVAQAAQWVANCDEAPAGFARLPDQFRARPLFVHAGDRFEVSGELRSTRQLLEQTPAAARVFARTTAAAGLPTSASRAWLLLGTLEALREFHPAFGPATTEAWVSVAIHELVHTHQLRQPDFAPYLQRIDAHTLQPAAITAHYASDAIFHARVEREYAQLVAAAQREPNAQAARRALRTWLRSYRTRSARLAQRADGAALREDERVFTYLEGVARFVESDFLANTAQHPPTDLPRDPHFHRFESFAGHGYRASPNRQLDAQYYYAIGYHLCVLLDRVDPGWKQNMRADSGWLIGVIERLH